MPKPIAVKDGDCVESIAYKERIRPDVVWDDPANDALKRLRKDRNVLMPGVDTVNVPDPVVKWEPNKKTGQTHLFQLKLPKKKFKFQLVYDKARTDLTCTVEVDKTPVPAVIQGEWLVCEIIPDAKEAVIKVSYPSGVAGEKAPLKELVYTVALGHLRPVDTDEGIEDRLKNLDFFSLLPDKKTPTPAEALERFQRSYGIDPKAIDARERAIEKLRELTGDPV